MALMPVPQLQTLTRGPVPADAVDLATKRVSSLLRLAPEPVLYAHLKLTMAGDPAVERPALAEVNLDMNGRLVRAQAAAGSLGEAIEQMNDRLRTRLSRTARNWAALRGSRPVSEPHEWRHESMPASRPPYYPRPPGERRVVRHKSYAIGRQAPADAVSDLELLDYDFYLFADEATGQDSVVYRTGGGYGLAQAHPQPGRLGPLGDSITLRSGRAPKLALADAIARLESLGERFLFFINRETGRGNVIYHRYDGHYGVITPAGA